MIKFDIKKSIKFRTILLCHKKKTIKFISVIIFFIILVTKLIGNDKYPKKLHHHKKLKIGVVSVRNDINVGNCLIKYAISIVLSKLGFIPYIIATHYNNYNITFVNKTTNLVIIKNNFSEIKRNDYDILMVNSDQTWRRIDNNFYDYGFLKFSKNWNIKKFVYGASLGFDFWTLNSEDERIAKDLLKNFTGISVREQGSVELIKRHFNIIPEVVLDPTFLINKENYLDLITYYSNNILNKNDNYIFVYKIFQNKKLDNFTQKSSKELNYSIYEIQLNNRTIIEDFIYSIFNSKAIITNSYHGSVFSIIFNKPFVAFNYKSYGAERLNSLGNLLEIQERIIDESQEPNVDLLRTSLNINLSKFEDLKKYSIDFIKRNLNL